MDDILKSLYRKLKVIKNIMILKPKLIIVYLNIHYLKWQKYFKNVSFKAG